jgi:uncharacterized protein (DUF952 family)
VIFHITTPAAWEAALSSGVYRAASLESEGFIHFSQASQLHDTAARHYAGVDGLIVLSVSESLLDDEMRIEDGFPHLYGPLPVRAVVEVRPLASAV